ncbi:hypothetical protein [Dokdonella sp.]|uniref:hypothetical protein n=1 Tax=Dokdonella sp. TaxID=2291710 RepID=UPI001B153CA3|nr:hypothetical protein [Dokdonella sp.]MBO9664043.1 hypothetical protein [Dokdonella sp.]
MEAILITETRSSIGERSLRNRVAWQVVNGERVVLAVGDPSEWRSSAPLPATAVVTDVVAASVDDPPLARELWGALLGYLAWPQVPRWHFALPRFLRPSRAVRIQLPAGPVRSAVCSAVGSAAGPLRFRERATD